MIQKVEKYQLVVEMRKAGASYSQICHKLGLSKNTLSGWFSKIAWLQTVRATLDLRWNQDSRDRILLMNSQRRQLINHNEEDAKNYWSQVLGIDTSHLIKTQVLPSRSNHNKKKGEVWDVRCLLLKYAI